MSDAQFVPLIMNGEPVIQRFERGWNCLVPTKDRIRIETLSVCSANDAVSGPHLADGLWMLEQRRDVLSLPESVDGLNPGEYSRYAIRIWPFDRTILVRYAGGRRIRSAYFVRLVDASKVGSERSWTGHWRISYNERSLFDPRRDRPRRRLGSSLRRLFGIQAATKFRMEEV